MVTSFYTIPVLCTTRRSQVFRVFFKRVLLCLKGMVAGGDAADVCVRNGMQSFVEELRPVGARLHRLFAHNVKVHSQIDYQHDTAVCTWCTKFAENNDNVRNTKIVHSTIISSAMYVGTRFICRRQV